MISMEEKNILNSFDTLTHSEMSEKMEQLWPYCSSYVWSYFFTRKIIKEERFPNVKISEDHIFILNVLKKCDKISFLKSCSFKTANYSHSKSKLHRSAKVSYEYYHQSK